MNLAELPLPSPLRMPPVVVRGSVEELLFSEETGLEGPGLLVHGASFERSGRRAALLARAGPAAPVFPWRHPGGEPTLAHLRALLDAARDAGARWFAGVGGGSVLDLAKAAAALLGAPDDVAAYHDGRPLPRPARPWVAAPSTAGTGSEATTVAVLTNERTGEKKSFRDPSMMARRVVLDASLLEGLPAPVLAASGMDALVQAIESYASRGATRFTDALAREAARVLFARLPAAAAHSRPEDRAALLEASFLAGVALSHARLGLVHGLAHPLGARYHQPHGRVCAAALVPVLRFNRGVLGAKYEDLCEAAGGDLVERCEALRTGLGLHSPFAAARLDDREGIVRETLASGSTKANPREVGAADVRRLLDEIFAGA